MQPEVGVKTGSKKAEEVDLVDDSNSIEALDESTKNSPVDSADDDLTEKDENKQAESEVEEITDEPETEQVMPEEPCTPHCPGATGFPDLECTKCQALFHSKCVGIDESKRSTFKCRVSLNHGSNFAQNFF